MDRSAVAAAAHPTPPTPREVLLSQLQGQQSSLALINATVALVFAGFAVLYAPHGPVVAWLAFLLLAQALRLVACGDGDRLALRLTLISLITGIGWGAMGWLFGTLDVVILDAVVAFVLAGMAAGSITALPAHPPAFGAFLLAALLPFAVRLGLDPRPHSEVMSLLTVLYFIGITYLGHHVWRTQTANAGLFLRNQALVDSLLEAGQQQEARVIERTRQLAEANALMAEEIRKRRRSEAQVRHLLHHDPLTNLPNRLVFADRLETALRRAERGRSLVAVALLDIDRFKTINDTLGHVTADLLLRAGGPPCRRLPGERHHSPHGRRRVRRDLPGHPGTGRCRGARRQAGSPAPPALPDRRRRGHGHGEHRRRPLPGPRPGRRHPAHRGRPRPLRGQAEGPRPAPAALGRDAGAGPRPSADRASWPGPSSAASCGCSTSRRPRSAATASPAPRPWSAG
ncbi:MAG: diguanylate cyclase [Geminicoccaceae bacterium]